LRDEFPIMTDAVGRLREPVSKRALRALSPTVAFRALSGVELEEEPSRRVVWDVPAWRSDATPLRIEIGWTAEVHPRLEPARGARNWRLRIAGGG
jgi:hypothetical protein